MTVRELLQANMAKVKDREMLVRIVVKASGAKRDSVMRILKSMNVAPSKKDTAGRTLDTFRSVFDIPLRIQQGIKKHLQDCYMSDQEFRDAVGVHPSQWRRYADADEFKPYRSRFGGQTLWSNKTMMAKMRNIAGIPQEL